MRFRKVTTVVTLATAATLVAAGCSSSKSGGGGGAAKSDSAACKKYADYQGNSGQKVNMYASITDPEGGFLKQSWKEFESCTGITIQYTGDKEFETQLKIKVEGGNAPDIAIMPQPGLLATFAKTGKLKPASAKVKALASKNWAASWIGYGSYNGQFYGAPMGSNAKSLVWYSPKAFKAKNYTVPTTWDEMISLSDKIVADGQKPWCAGIESGTATGWTATDWMEEVMLRLYGPDVYKQWYTHEIPFNDQKVQDVLAKVGQIWKNDKYVNAGIGNVKSIATTAFAKAGLPLATGKCWMHQQASFYGANWPKGKTIGPDGDIYAFYEPAINSQFPKPVEGGAEFVTAFSDKPAVQAVQLYLASADWATSRAKVHPGWTSANKNVDKTVYTDPVDKLSVDILTDPKAVIGFDASDLMPSSVGTGSFWKQMTQWVLGQNDKATLDNVENSWPK
ncbi:MAG: ABC transporter substrate-binding protein [bacterium]